MIYKVKPNTLTTVITKHYQGKKSTISNDYDANDKGVFIGRLQRSQELKDSILSDVVSSLPKGVTLDQDYVDYKIKQATPDTVNLFNTNRAIAPFKVRVAKNKGLYATPSSAFKAKDKLDGKADTSISQFWS